MFVPDDLAEAKISDLALRLYLVLRGYDRGNGVFPSMYTLARQLGRARSTVYLARDELIEIGFVKVEKADGAYRYVFPRDGL